MGVEKVIERWVTEQLGERVVQMLPPNQDGLGVMTLAVRRANAEIPPVPPEEVLVAWHRALAGARTTLQQSEDDFLRSARAAGWPDERIAEMLGLADVAELVTHQQRLKRLLVDQHPSRRPSPWTGGDWAPPTGEP